MKTTHIKKFIGTPYSIEVSAIENAPGQWNSSKVVICCEDPELKVIGEYIRNYPSFSKDTFYPFRAVDDNWYALYSTHYTATRVMRLYEDRIEDWCGQDPDSRGFCPTEFYIPQYHTLRSTLVSGQNNQQNVEYYLVDNECDDQDWLSEGTNSHYTGYCNFGFVSGCLWGDDSSWKLRYVDLKDIPNKKLSITEKFGYWQLPNNMSLKESVSLTGWEPNNSWVGLTKFEYINLDTNERC